MSAADLKLRDIIARLEAGWRWWIDELSVLVPDWLNEAFASSGPMIAIELSDRDIIVRRFSDGAETKLAHIPRAEFDAAALHQVVAPFLEKRRFFRECFAIRIPDKAALSRTLSLPRAARRNLANILRFELDRQSPVDRNEVYYDYRVLRSAADQIQVEMRIARREMVDPVLAICRQASVPIAVIAFASDARPAVGGNFPVDAEASVAFRIQRHLVRGLAALVCALAIGVVAGAYFRNQAEADDLAARAEQAHGDARAVIRLDREIADANARSVFLVQEKRHPMMVRVLAEISRILPDGSWLSEVEIQNGEVRIQGLSGSAASLIALFDASPLFANAQFRAPLVQPPGTALERFDMSFTIRGAR